MLKGTEAMTDEKLKEMAREWPTYALIAERL